MKGMHHAGYVERKPISMYVLQRRLPLPFRCSQSLDSSAEKKTQQLPYDRCNLVPLMRELTPFIRLLQGHYIPSVQFIIVQRPDKPSCQQRKPNVSFMAELPRPEVDDRQYGEQEETVELNLRLSLLDGRMSREVSLEDVSAP